MTTAPVENLTAERVWRELGQIPDPEIPVLSLVELGVISDVSVDGAAVRVGLRPTFAGCPALHAMRLEIRERLAVLGASAVNIDLVLDPPWSTDDLGPEARAKLTAFGLAPPPTPLVRIDDVLAAPRACPRCGSVQTEVRNDFGPTPCRTIHYCRSCRQPFEGMKPI
jgi:ring-1,2-phenylacetyl-CoA epoxidase subunit PaaD